MFLYLIEMNYAYYDQFDGFVVAAQSEDDALAFLEEEYPMEKVALSMSLVRWDKGYTVSLIGTAADTYTETTEVLASFNAG